MSTPRGRSCPRILAVTSRDVVFRILFGISPTADLAAVDDAISYTLAAAGRESDSDGRELPTSPTLSTHFSPGLDGNLASRSLSSWATTTTPERCSCASVRSRRFRSGRRRSRRRDRRLLDDFVLWTTPSATAHAAALRRAAATTSSLASLVSVADPTGDLRFARAEVRQLSGAFDELTLRSAAMRLAVG